MNLSVSSWKETVPEKAGMNLRAIEEKFQVENVSKSIELQYIVDV